MKIQIAALLISGISLFNSVKAQDEVENLSVNNNPDPFLFSLSTLTPEDSKWNLDYSGGYGNNVESPMGFDGVSQQFGIKGYLGGKFTMSAFIALGFQQDNNVSSAQQLEIIRNFLGGKKYLGWRIGAGLGGRRDFYSEYSLLGRVTSEYIGSKWKANGNLLFEKVFESDRDAVDIITSIGFQYRIAGGFYGGIEAIGEDLEGFWDDEEAEGGAKLMVGPSLNFVPKDSRFAFSLSGGPVILANENENTNPVAIRELPTEAGMMIRAKIIFRFI